MNWNLLLLKLSARKKTNIIAGVICRHPSIDLTDFNYKKLSKLVKASS